MDLRGELVKVLDELSQINQNYLEASPEAQKAHLARVGELAARVEELTAAVETTLQGIVAEKPTPR